MDLAIVIPYFKKKFFKSCLDSLAGQTNKNFRVYVGNDGSLQNPEDLIKSYSEILSIEYYYFAENLGSKSLVAHWNRCLEKTKGERWIIILGDDDALGENCVDSFYKALNEINQLNINVVRFATKRINSENQVISDIFQHPKVEKSLDFLFRKINGKTRSSLSEYIFRKDKLQDVGLRSFPLAWHTDDLLILECSDLEDVFTLNDSQVFFRTSELNISSLNNNLIEKNKASFLFYSYLLKNYNSKFNKDQRKVLYIKLLNSYNNNKLNFYMLSRVFKLTLDFNYNMIFLKFWKNVILFKFQKSRFIF